MKIYAFADEASPMMDEQILAMKQHGLSGLEIRNVDKVNVADISDAKAKEVKDKMDAAGLKVWSVGSPIGKIDIETGNFDVHTEKFRRTLEIAQILGAENIRLFSFFMPNEKNPGDYKEEVIARLRVFADLAKGTGVTLCHENEKGIYGDVPERCLEIYQAVPDLRGIFDPANFVQCGVDIKKAWNMLGKYTKYLHIKDALSDGKVVPVGKGVGEISYLLEQYQKMGGHAVTLEPHLRVFDGLSALEKEDDKSVVGEIYCYSSNEEAFAAAVDALQDILKGM